MNVAILIINKSEYVSIHGFDIEKMSRQLSYKGYDIKTVIETDISCDIEKNDVYLKSLADAVIVCGQTELYYEFLSGHYTILKNLSVIEIENTIYAFLPEYKDNFIIDSVIPALNSKSKTYYNTVIFKTCSKTEAQLKEILKDYIRNKNRISFRFIENVPECEVQIKFSSKMQKPVVDSTIAGTARLLGDAVYATEDVSLAHQVADYLKVHNKKICIAESFTGGSLTKSLVDIAGASAYLKEGIVAYSNDAKIKRLKVSPNILSSYGGVSIEAVYEMAANQLIDNSDCDICVATSGNAGPTAEKAGEEGLCYIAVGNKHGIHIYRHNFEGKREEIIKQGTVYALYYAYKKLKESEFSDLLNVYEKLN